MGYQFSGRYSSSEKVWYWRRPRNNSYLPGPIRTTERDASLISPPVIQVPASLVVTAAAFREFMRKNRVDEVVEGLLESIDVQNLEELQHPAGQIQEVIKTSPLPDQVFESIMEGYDALGSGTTLIWPVAMPLEIFQYTREYQRFPYLEAEGLQETMGAIRSWWASLYDSIAIFYRELNGQRHRDAKITVAAQRVTSSASDSSA